MMQGTENLKNVFGLRSEFQSRFSINESKFYFEKKAALAMQIDIPIPILDLGSGHIAGQICDLMLRHGTQYIFVKYIPIKPLQTKKFNASRVEASTNI